MVISRVAILARVTLSAEVSEIGDALLLDGCTGARHSDALARAIAETERAGDAMNGGPPRLTARELEVIGLVARGLTNPAIAAHLGVSPHTVKRHLANIFVKENITSRAQAAVVAAHAYVV